MRLKKGIFITGTDTDAGKTVVAAALLAALRLRGMDAVPMKAVQTGAKCKGSVKKALDLEFCLKIAGLNIPAEEKCLMAPYLLGDPCSPHLAAQREGVTISLALIKRSMERLAGLHDMVVVEGAGGLMVPITGRKTMLDLSAKMGLPVLLVGRAGLGTLNHVLLSVEALKSRGIIPAGIVLNENEQVRSGYIEKDNLKTIRSLVRSSPVIRFPHIKGNLCSEHGRKLLVKAGIRALAQLTAAGGPA